MLFLPEFQATCCASPFSAAPAAVSPPSIFLFSGPLAAAGPWLRGRGLWGWLGWAVPEPPLPSAQAWAAQRQAGFGCS